MIKSELVDDESPNFNQNSEIDSTEAINMNALNKLKKQNLLTFIFLTLEFSSYFAIFNPFRFSFE